MQLFSGWKSFGVSRGGPSDPTSPTALSTSAFTVFACTRDDTNQPGSNVFPRHCIIMSVEVELAAIAGSAGSSGADITMYLTRDSGADIPLTPSGTSGAVQAMTVGKTTTSEGCVIFPVEVDFHRLAEGTADTIYVCLKTSALTVKVEHVRVNWRA